MMKSPKLFMLLLGATVPGRHTEQHDVFFSIGQNLADLVPDIEAFWPEASKIHIDAWREVNYVDGSEIKVVPKAGLISTSVSKKLFFLNLGGYKPGEFEEYHYKMLVTAADIGEAVNKAKGTAFFKHTGFSEANSHIDNKYGVDVDDFFNVADILSPGIKENYALQFTTTAGEYKDELHLGYFKLTNLAQYS